MYQHRGLGQVGPTSGINWEDVAIHGIDTAAQLIRPSAFPQYPVYSPGGAAAVSIAQSPGIWILGAGLLALLLLKR
jgi:hypothetical protein